jgi:protein TonB
MSEIERNKDKRIGWAVSASIHALIVLLFFLINAWTAPDPPLPEYGIELNFGIEEAGSGFEQPVTQPTPPTVEEQGEPEEQIVEEQEEVVVEEQPDPEPVENTAVEELPDSQQEDSPVETKPAEVPKQATKPVEKEVKETKPATKSSEQPPKEVPKVEENKPTLDNRAIMKSSSSQGSNTSQAGDEGNLKGNPDSRNQLGPHGGGQNGPTLNLLGGGWEFDTEPVVIDDITRNGKVVFNIEVNADGDVTIVGQPKESTVSPQVLTRYRDAVASLTLKAKNNPKPTTGTITFIIKSQ